MAALQGATPLTSVSLNGTATWTAGSYSDSGTIALEAAAGGYSRVDIELAGGSRISVRGPRDSRPGALPGGAVRSSGALAVGEGGVRARPLGAAWAPAQWFVPALALSEAAAGAVIPSDLGAVAINGANTDHLRLERAASRQTPAQAAQIARLSQADYYLDPATHLPVALDFTEHPTGVVNRGGIRVEIRYSGWRADSGVQIPYHIERWVNGTRQLVIAVNAVQINPPLAPTEFEIGGAQ